MTIATTPEVYGKLHAGLYPADMVRRVMRGIQDIRLQMGDVFRGIEERREHIVFTRRGRQVAVLVPIEWYREAAQAMNDPTEF